MSFTCTCLAVRDHEVIEVIDSGARTVDEVTAACAAGSDCGSCVPTIEAFLALADPDGSNKATQVSISQA